MVMLSLQSFVIERVWCFFFNFNLFPFRVRFFEMEESSSSFPEIFNAKKSTLCVRDAEIEITSDKCLIRGQAAILGEDCPTGISIRSFSEK
jgi:hypothetical protein